MIPKDLFVKHLEKQEVLGLFFFRRGEGKVINTRFSVLCGRLNGSVFVLSTSISWKRPRR